MIQTGLDAFTVVLSLSKQKECLISNLPLYALSPSYDPVMLEKVYTRQK